MNASSETYSAPKTVDIQACSPSVGSVLVNAAIAVSTIPTATSRSPLPSRTRGTAASSTTTRASAVPSAANGP